MESISLSAPRASVGTKLEQRLLQAYFMWLVGNVKEHATLSAGASVDHGVNVKTTEAHVKRAADRGCCVSTCWVSSVLLFRGLTWFGKHNLGKVLKMQAYTQIQ
jgi:hypothetical protein